ncbi:MAG: hypothetical protein ACOYLB_14065, partial [Phototrophicaceae bacterium]
QTVEPALSVIHPNERAPYHFYMGHLTLEQIAGVGTLLVGGSETDTATARFVPLQTQNLTYERLDNQVKVTFEVVNPTEQTAQNVRVLVAFYEGDHVLAYRIFERAGSFPPQTTWQVAESLLLISSAVTDSPPILQLEAPLQQDALPTPTP